MTLKQIAQKNRENSKPLFDISSLASAYPTGEHLMGNFITAYTSNSQILDAKILRKFGEQKISFDKDLTDTEIMTEYNVEIQGIVFSHLTDWAKMFSAMIKDYEPLWNVDGTVKTTYGATKDTMKYGQTQLTMTHGAQDNSDIYAQRTNTEGGGTDTHNTYKTTYPDATERKTDKGEDIIAQRTNTIGGGTDRHTTTQYNDINTQNTHTDEKDSIQHIDTEERTGNIGVTKSTDLVESEIILRSKYGFWDIIASMILKEMGANYYEN